MKRSYFELEKFMTKIPNEGRLLGFDVGKKIVGIAISDEKRNIATSFDSLIRKNLEYDKEFLKKIHQEYEILAWVVGYPKHMSGEEGKQCRYTMQFIQQVRFRQDIPVLFWDERWSTKAISYYMDNKKKELIDRESASYILQGVLDGIKKLKLESENNVD